MQPKQKRMTFGVIAVVCFVSILFILTNHPPAFSDDPSTATPIRIGYSDTLALIDPSSGKVSLIDSIEDYAHSAYFHTYPLGIGTLNYKNDFVMGDWDGDGQKTPGALSRGAFYYTNTLQTADPNWTNDWTQIWLGPEGKPVAGYFDSKSDHDCIGVVDQKKLDGTNDTLAFYYTCDFSGSAVPKSQALGVLLPRSELYAGPFQFVAGDWDGDGVESLAVRRGSFIRLTNDAPSTTETPLFETPIDFTAPKTNEYGVVVAGDWDGDGIDTFGLFYQLDSIDVSEFYYRNDFDLESGDYLIQHIRDFLESPFHRVHLFATSWRQQCVLFSCEGFPR